MANIKSSKKHAKKSEKMRRINSSNRSMLRTFIKKVRIAIHSGNIKKARESFSILQPIIDRQVHKKLIHKNKAARHKSIFNLAINKMNK